MDQQTTLNGRRPEPSAAEGMSRNLGDFLHDILCLAELQWQLLGMDLREAFQKSLLPAGLSIAAVLIAIGSVPLVLMGVVWVLVLRAGLSQDVAFLATAGTGILLAALLGYVAFQKFTHLGSIVSHSQQEFSQNLRWIKHALRKHRQAVDE